MSHPTETRPRTEFFPLQKYQSTLSASITLCHARHAYWKPKLWFAKTLNYRRRLASPQRLWNIDLIVDLDVVNLPLPLHWPKSHLSTTIFLQRRGTISISTHPDQPSNRSKRDSPFLFNGWTSILFSSSQPCGSLCTWIDVQELSEASHTMLTAAQCRLHRMPWAQASLRLVACLRITVHGPMI